MLDSWSMKKFFAIIVFSLLCSESIFAEIKPLNPNTPHTLIIKPAIDEPIPNNRKTTGELKFTSAHKTFQQAKDVGLELCRDRLIKKFKRPDIAKSCVVHSYKGNKEKNFTIIFDQEVAKINKSIKKEQLIKKKEKQDSIMFTIKDKREQCEAIGFKPQTEKFADCVLRLVELDIKKQQDNRIASAQNSGNIQIANQLRQMRNDNNAQYLIDLGQQLLKPQSFNSNIYLPQTQNCTITGFDNFAKMRCF